MHASKTWNFSQILFNAKVSWSNKQDAWEINQCSMDICQQQHFQLKPKQLKRLNVCHLNALSWMRGGRNDCVVYGIFWQWSCWWINLSPCLWWLRRRQMTLFELWVRHYFLLLCLPCPWIYVIVQVLLGSVWIKMEYADITLLLQCIMYLIWFRSFPSSSLTNIPVSFNDMILKIVILQTSGKFIKCRKATNPIAMH